MGNVLRPCTSQSETVYNNKLTWQKEVKWKRQITSAIDLTKLKFVRDEWKEVDQQPLELKLAICILSEEYHLVRRSSNYLEAYPEVRFEWPEEK